MMISGAAKLSDPQRVCKRGELGLMKRERPKSVSFMSGLGRRSRGMEEDEVGGRRKGFIVRRISRTGQHTFSLAVSCDSWDAKRIESTLFDSLSSLISR